MSDTQGTDVVKGAEEKAVGVQLRLEVADLLKATAPEMVRTRVKEQLVEAKLKEYTQLVLDALVKRDELQKALKAIVPDHVIKDAEGKTLNSGFTEKRFAELKKAQTAVETLDKVLSAAMTDGSFDKLAPLVKVAKTEGNPEKGA